MSTNLLFPVSSDETPDSLSVTNPSGSDSGDPRIMKLMKSYQADQQVKYLHLQAEIEVLLQQLQKLKKEKISSDTSDIQRSEIAKTL